MPEKTWSTGVEESDSTTNQKGFVELERTRELTKQLMHAVEPLQEDGTTFIDVIGCRTLSTAISKFVSKLQPLFFHQDAESLSHATATQQVSVCTAASEFTYK